MTFVLDLSIHTFYIKSDLGLKLLAKVTYDLSHEIRGSRRL